MKTDDLRRTPAPTRARADAGARVLEQVARRLPEVSAGAHGYRPLEADDYWRLWLATRNPEFNRCLPWPAPAAPQQTLLRVRQLMREREQGHSISFACETPAAGRQWDAIFRFTRWRDGLETGLWLHPDAWGQGIGTRIIAVAIDAAFESSAIAAVYSKTSVDNIGAHRITTRCGMRVVGEASAPDERGGTIHGIEWRITRAEAQRLPNGVAGRIASAA